MQIDASMINDAKRLKRERQTIRIMAEIYCHDQHHSPDGLCELCDDLLAYAMERLDHCVYQENKPTCANCPIHCYKRVRREQVRVMMRHAGTRMLFSHPILAVFHIVDGKRKTPQRPQKR
jgi:hypothetical protein